MSSREKEKSSDVTIYGATSFVARYVAEYLFEVIEKNPSLSLRVTLAGRNTSKIEERLRELRDVVPETRAVVVDVFRADASDAVALREMAGRTRVVVQCAGPFSAYGDGVVAACAEAGTDYVDITGEVDWAARARRTHRATAERTGARLVSFCGFDSIPSDAAVLGAVRALRGTFGDDVSVVRATTWHDCAGLMNGGTLHTALDMEIDARRCVRNPKTGARRRIPFFAQDPFELRRDDNDDDVVSEEWTNEAAKTEWLNNLPSIDSEPFVGTNVVSVPFLMAVCNAKILHASAAALGYHKGGDGDGDGDGDEKNTRFFVYRERFLPAGFALSRRLGLLSAVPALLFLWGMGVATIVLKLPYVGKRLATLLLPPGTGSPDAVSRRGHATVHAIAEGVGGERASCRLSFQGDPGNLVTAQCVVEAALCLATRSDDLSRRRGGFFTPAEAFGDVLLSRFASSPVRPVATTTDAWRQNPEIADGADVTTKKKSKES